MIDKTSKEVAANMKKIRLHKGLTQLEVAKKAGINSNYYAKIERGKLKPSVAKFEKIVKALEVKSSDILPF